MSLYRQHKNGSFDDKFDMRTSPSNDTLHLAGISIEHLLNTFPGNLNLVSHTATDDQT